MTMVAGRKRMRQRRKHVSGPLRYVVQRKVERTRNVDDDVSFIILFYFLRQISL